MNQPKSYLSSDVQALEHESEALNSDDDVEISFN